MTSRKAFEAQMREHFGAHANLARSEDGYIGTAPHAVIPMTYASVQMLWEGWQAAIQHARDVAEDCIEHELGETGQAKAIVFAIKEALK